MLTTYVAPHFLEPAKEEAKRAFTAIVKEAKEGMQAGKGEWQAGLKVYKEERAGKGSSHEVQSRPAGREPAGQPLAVQQAAPARFSCQTAWASRTPPDIAAWYFSPEAPDIYSHFQSGWARKDPQDSIDWIFRMVAPPEENETSKSQAAGTDIHTEEMAARMESQAGRPSQMAQQRGKKTTGQMKKGSQQFQ